LKTIAVVGPKKSGKTLLVTSLVESLKRYGTVGTVKHMPHYAFEDKGDTRRHFEAGADVVIGVGRVQFKVTRDGSLESALDELRSSGVDFAVVEGFKRSNLPKIVLGGIEVPHCIRRVDVSQIDEGLVEDLVRMVIDLVDQEG